MDAQIIVKPESESRFEISVREGNSETRHRVTVDAGFAGQLTGGKIEPKELLRRSFEFLLEREPKESILRQFDLRDIGRYFPEYEREIRQRIRS